MDSDFVVGINKSIDAANGETGKTYPSYLHNTLVTEKLDELAEAISKGGGGGGASALSDLTDVDITNPTDGQVIKFDAALNKWVNANSGGGSSITVLDGNLDAGETSITFTDERILEDSIVSCASPAGVNPVAMTSTTGSVTFHFTSQAADMVVKAVIF